MDTIELNPRNRTTIGAILSAAADDLEAHGVAGLRVDNVARAAGINKRMIYHYFGDRNGLVGAVLHQQKRILDAQEPRLRAMLDALTLQPAPCLSSHDQVDAASSTGQAARILLPFVMAQQRSLAQDLSQRSWLRVLVALAMPELVTSSKTVIRAASAPRTL